MRHFCTQLSKYYNEDKNDWNDYLSSVVYAYNTGIHATTGFASYELVCERKTRSPFDIKSETRPLCRHLKALSGVKKITQVLNINLVDRLTHPYNSFSFYMNVF